MGTINHTDTELMQLIKDRVTSYYSEISSSYIVIRNNHPPQKYHTSLVYQFDVLIDNCLYKSLIVKKRIFNPNYNNDIEKDTNIEFNNLKLLNGKEIGNTVPRVLEAIPQAGILISEKVEGVRLAAYLKRFSYLGLNTKKLDFLSDTFIRAGRWLKSFHKIMALDKTGKINTQEYISKAEQILNEFYSLGLSQKLGRVLIEAMKKNEDIVAALQFPVAFKHGDFQPMNVVCDKDRIIVMDIDSQKQDICIKDVCNFVVGVTVFDIKCLYSFINRDIKSQLLNTFLKAYFSEAEIPGKAINFVTALGLLEFLQYSYKRNRNPLKRIRILAFYSKRLNEFLNNLNGEAYV